MTYCYNGGVTKSVEAIAELYRRHGWEKQEGELEADAQRFKTAGVPEHFESDVQEEEKPEPIQTLKRQLVEILAAETVDPNRPKNKKLLTPVLAAKLNQVGQKFDDKTRLSELAVKEKGTYIEFHIPGQSFTGENQIYEIQHGIVSALGMLINGLQRQGLETVGAVRNAPPARELYKELWRRSVLSSPSGSVSLYFKQDGIQFMKTTLAKPPQTKPPTARK